MKIIKRKKNLFTSLFGKKNIHKAAAPKRKRVYWIIELKQRCDKYIKAPTSKPNNREAEKQCVVCNK